jgi:hypothetical protein
MKPSNEKTLKRLLGHTSTEKLKVQVVLSGFQHDSSKASKFNKTNKKPKQIMVANHSHRAPQHTHTYMKIKKLVICIDQNKKGAKANHCGKQQPQSTTTHTYMETEKPV